MSFVLAVFLAWAGAGPASAQTADVTAALTEASKLMQKGGYAKAIEVIDAALRSGQIQAELAAKALLMRAEANEKLGRMAFAFADYNSALWMQGLSQGDRKRAEDGHARVQKTLGVSAPAGGGGQEGGAPQGGGSWNTAVQEQPSGQGGSSGGIGGFFNNLFGSSSPKQEEEPPTASVAVVTPVEQAPPAQARGGRKAAAPAVAYAQTETRATAPVSIPKPSDTGNFAIQLAAVMDEEKAIYEADRLAKKYREDFGGHSPSLMIVPTADGGTLYKVVLAAYETKGEGQAACELLKTRGLSCMVIVKK